MTAAHKRQPRRFDQPCHFLEAVGVSRNEDEPQVRAVAARALRSAGYRVLEATNGRDGLQVARRERESIDLIV